MGFYFPCVAAVGSFLALEETAEFAEAVRVARESRHLEVELAVVFSTAADAVAST